MGNTIKKTKKKILWAKEVEKNKRQCTLMNYTKLK